jgi:hypothetical protein
VAGQAARKPQAQQVNSRQAYNSLAGAGAPADEAFGAIMNPNLSCALAVKYLGPKSPGQRIEQPGCGRGEWPACAAERPERRRSQPQPKHVEGR